MEEKDSVLYLTPGSCGLRRLDQETTFAVMTAENRKFQVEKVVVPNPKRRSSHASVLTSNPTGSLNGRRVVEGLGQTGYYYD